MSTTWAGPIEFSGPELVVIFAIFFLVPPLAFSILATGIHYVVRRNAGPAFNPTRTFLTWWIGSTLAWMVLLALWNGIE